MFYEISTPPVSTTSGAVAGAVGAPPCNRADQCPTQALSRYISDNLVSTTCLNWACLAQLDVSSSMLIAGGGPDCLPQSPVAPHFLARRLIPPDD